MNILKKLLLKKNLIVLFLTILLINIGCFKVVERGYSGKTNTDIDIPAGDYEFYETGTASWYGKKFHGRPTSSGEIFNMYKFSAAHKTIPLGTYILVINKSNGKSIKVKVNDRGPFIKGRVLDLSYAAAKKIGYADLGLTKVDIFIYGKLKRECYSIQLGAFQEKSRAYNLLKKIQRETIEKVFVVNESGLYKVFCGKFKKRDVADKFKLNNSFVQNGFVVSCK